MAQRYDSHGAHAAAAPDTVSWRAGAECEAAITGSAEARAEDNGGRGRLPTRTQQAGAHDVGETAGGFAGVGLMNRLVLR